MEMLSDMGSIPIISTTKGKEVHRASFPFVCEIIGNRTHMGWET